MTDTVLVCETGERVAAAAHLAVLSSHWVWAYLLMGRAVSQAYVYIEDGKYKFEPGRGDVKELVKLEHDLVGAIDLDELEFM